MQIRRKFRKYSKRCPAESQSLAEQCIREIIILTSGESFFLFKTFSPNYINSQTFICKLAEIFTGRYFCYLYKFLSTGRFRGRGKDSKYLDCGEFGGQKQNSFKELRYQR